MSKTNEILEAYKIHSTIKTQGGGVKNTPGQTKAICPYCHKIMQSQIAHRWHLDNCKMKGK
jgi:hypothetical protein